MTKIMVLIFSMLPLILTGCVTAHTVSEKQLGDNNLSCQEMADRLGELKTVKAMADEDSGVSGENIAAALLFWPAIFGNQSNVKQTRESADKRTSELVKHYENKSCSEPVTNYSKEQMKEMLKNKTTIEDFS